MDNGFYPDAKHEDFDERAASIKAKFMLIRQRAENQKLADAEFDELNRPRTKKVIVDLALTVLLTAALYIISLIAVDVLPQYESVINSLNRYRVYVLIAIPAIYLAVILISAAKRSAQLRKGFTDSRAEWTSMLEKQTSLVMKWIDLDDRERAVRASESKPSEPSREVVDRLVAERIAEKIKNGELTYPAVDRLNAQGSGSQSFYNSVRNTGSFAPIEQSMPLQQPQARPQPYQPPMQNSMPYIPQVRQSVPLQQPQMQQMPNPMQQPMSPSVQQMPPMQNTMSQPPIQQMRPGQPIRQMPQQMRQPQQRPQMQQNPQMHQNPQMPNYGQTGRPQPMPQNNMGNPQGNFYNTGSYGGQQPPQDQGFAYPAPPIGGMYPPQQ